MLPGSRTGHPVPASGEHFIPACIVSAEVQRNGLWLALTRGHTLAQFPSLLAPMAMPVQPHPRLALNVGEISRESRRTDIKGDPVSFPSSKPASGPHRKGCDYPKTTRK